jgi:hypothetical protein
MQSIFLFGTAFSISLRRCHFYLKKKNSVIKSRLALKGDIKMNARSAQRLSIRDGQFALFRNNKNDIVLFDIENEYRFFDTAYSQELIKGLLTTFPSLNNFIAKPVNTKKPPLIHSFASGNNDRNCL